jgi:hypothetical protein
VARAGRQHRGRSHSWREPQPARGGAAKRGGGALCSTSVRRELTSAACAAPTHFAAATQVGIALRRSRQPHQSGLFGCRSSASSLEEPPPPPHSHSSSLSPARSLGQTFIKNFTLRTQHHTDAAQISRSRSTPLGPHRSRASPRTAGEALRESSVPPAAPPRRNSAAARCISRRAALRPCLPAQVQLPEGWNTAAEHHGRLSSEVRAPARSRRGRHSRRAAAAAALRPRAAPDRDPAPPSFRSRDAGIIFET